MALFLNFFQLFELMETLKKKWDWQKCKVEYFPLFYLFFLHQAVFISKKLNSAQ